MSLNLPIYLDNHATTPIDARVLDAMLPYLTTKFGNASSRNHVFGWEAEAAVEAARDQVRALIGAESEQEIVFTSGATESDNLALKGVAEAYRERGNHVITAAAEHTAILDTCKCLERQGFDVTYLAVGSDGLVDPDVLRRAITGSTVLVSIMLANNEVGTIQPIAEIGALVRERGLLFHCDAVQGVGKIPFDVREMNVDLASISAHKMYGPKGIGALYVRRSKPRARLVPIIDGGGHERGMRSGTLNVPGIVGFGMSAAIAMTERDSEAARVLRLREELRRRLISGLEHVHLNGSLDHRLPGNLSMSFDGVESEALMILMKDVAVSNGSACTTARVEPSHVLRALGVDEQRAFGAIRFGIGRFNTSEEIDYVADVVVENVNVLRTRFGVAS